MKQSDLPIRTFSAVMVASFLFLSCAASATPTAHSPEQLVTSYEVACDGRTAKVSILEDSGPTVLPAATIELANVVPLGSSVAVAPPMEVRNAFANMSYIAGVQWICINTYPIIVITYGAPTSEAVETNASGLFEAWLKIDERGITLDSIGYPVERP